MAIGLNKALKGCVDGLGGPNETNLTAATYTAAGVIDTSDILVKLNHSAGQAMTWGDGSTTAVGGNQNNVAGRWLIIYHQNADTNAKTVTFSGVTLTTDFNTATATVITTNAAGECVVLYGISPTQFYVVLNIGGAVLS